MAEMANEVVRRTGLWAAPTRVRFRKDRALNFLWILVTRFAWRLGGKTVPLPPWGLEADQFPLLQGNEAVTIGTYQGDVVAGDDDEGGFGDFPQQRVDGLGVFRVQGPGRFVDEKEGRPLQYGPGQGNPHGLTIGKGAGLAIEQIGDPAFGKDLLIIILDAIGHDVFPDRQIGHEVGRGKAKTDDVPPVGPKGLALKGKDIGSVIGNLTGIGLFEGADELRRVDLPDPESPESRNMP